MLSVYYSDIYSYLIYAIEFWGCAAKSLTNQMTIVKNTCIRIICIADYHAHVPTLAKPIGILQFNDLFKFYLLNLMFCVHFKSCCPLLSCNLSRTLIAHWYNSRKCKFFFY